MPFVTLGNPQRKTKNEDYYDILSLTGFAKA